MFEKFANLDPAIQAAIIIGICTIVVGICTIIAALINRPRKRKKEEQEREKAVVAKSLPTAPREQTVKVEISTPQVVEKKAQPIEVPKPPAPYFAHPYPLQENFTGREAERNELTEWFTKSDKPMFAYIAIGGMGKSALTWVWLNEDIIKKDLAPEGIIWWSFYDKEARFETFLGKALQYVSEGKIDPKDIPSNRERMDTLYNLLYNKRFLLVLDGVERVLRAYAGMGSPYQGDEVTTDEREDFRRCIDPNVATFLQELATGNLKTKTLLTSRLKPKELEGIAGCECMDLTKMSKKDAVDFFHRQGVKGHRAEIESVCEIFGYHPL
ncbi:MAG: hypothetical protein AMJ90_07575, partial [candidate division Zixibacteria bacterium SM23_73_2]